MITASASNTGEFRGVPAYFRACCAEAQQGGVESYGNPAWHLAIHLETEMPEDLKWPEWREHIQELRELLRLENDEAIIEWFEQHYPKCMELVPRRRHAAFLNGIYAAYEADRI